MNNRLILISLTFLIFFIDIISLKGINIFTRFLFSKLIITTWDFSDIEFRSIGILTKTYIIKNLKLISNIEKPMKIKSNKINVNGNFYHYALSLGGKGNPYNRSISFENYNTSTIKIIGRSTGSNRNLLITDINKNILGSLIFTSTPELKILIINYLGKIFIYSENNNIEIYKIELEYYSSNNSSSNSSKDDDLPTEEIIQIITSNNESEFYEAIEKINNNGGKIYINTPLISISSTSTIYLSNTKSSGIIGVKQPDGTYPRIDFKNARNKGSSERGFSIIGANKYIKYLIIENAGDNGIYISGNKNIIDHVITRYNNDTGIQISEKADSNTLNYCYSYRNIDIKNYGANADGFAPKLFASNTVFNYCFSWDNSDDGWDSFDKIGDNTSSVTFRHSACWNNGNTNVFTGKYDYDNGDPLDKNLWTIQQIMNSDPNFEMNYNNKKFNISKAKIEGENIESWLSKAEIKMNGNGFKLGSNITEQSTNIKRTADYCVVFDHKANGFDNNFSEGCSGYITNCVSFNNNINYQLPYYFVKWSNNWSFNAKKSDQINMNQTLNIPKNVDSVEKNFYSIRNKIIKEVYSNKFPDDINFDKAIDFLNLSSISISNYILYIIFLLIFIVLIIFCFFKKKIRSNFGNIDNLKENIEKIYE